jgi:LysR family transcriptional regulator, nitrogen assimilation regulatory protein
MSLTHIERFIEIADSGSLSRAAIKLGLNQPTLSRALRELESKLGCDLLYRNGRGVVLTNEGQQFYDNVREAVEQIKNASRSIANPARPLVERAVIAMPPTVGRILTKPLALALTESFPGAQLRFIEAFSGHLLEWLSNGRLDVAILYDSGITQRLHAEPLHEERLSLVATPTSIGSLTQISFADACRHHLILPSPPHGLRRLLEFISREQNMKMDLVTEVDALPSILDLVEAGLGWTILPRAAVQREITEGRLAAIPIVDPEVKRTLVLATASNRPLERGRKEVIRVIKEQLRVLATELP